MSCSRRRDHEGVRSPLAFGEIGGLQRVFFLRNRLAVIGCRTSLCEQIHDLVDDSHQATLSLTASSASAAGDTELTDQEPRSDKTGRPRDAG